MKNLSEKSLLVYLNISCWSARKYDRKATDEVNKKHNATNAGRFNKLLIGQDHLSEITKIAGQVRNYHYDNTLPWSDAGDRLLPAENYFTYTEEISKLKNDFDNAVRNFIDNYPAMIEEARQSLNGLFKDDDYPKFISDKFRVKTAFMPVPDVADIRVNLSDAEIESLREDVTKEMNERFAGAQTDIYRRMSEQLTHMKEKLDDKKAIFRDSLFENILPLVELLPRLNIANDPHIKEMCDELKSLYCDPETVRNNVRERKAKAQEVDNMLSKLNDFFKPA